MAQQVIYIHGFNSSEQSAKAVQFGEYLSDKKVNYHAPRLHYDPAQAIAQLEALITPSTGLIGSSLGGYYATYLSQKFQLNAVLVNPTVRPFELFNDYLGKQYNPYQQQHYQLTKTHLEALKSLYNPDLAFPERLFLLQQTADEVLDYQQAVAYYQLCRQCVEQGGSHRFENFERHFAEITAFLNITQ